MSGGKGVELFIVDFSEKKGPIDAAAADGGVVPAVDYLDLGHF